VIEPQALCVYCGVSASFAQEKSMGMYCARSAVSRSNPIGIHRFDRRESQRCTRCNCDEFVFAELPCISADGSHTLEPWPDPLNLNLGANDRRFPGFLSVDVAPPADFLCDLRYPWPWKDGSVSTVYAYDVFEHLPDKRHTMNELWRVLKPGGVTHLQIPHATLGDGGHCDPTHVSFWTSSDFEYYHPGIAERERFRASTYYGVKADFRVRNLTKPGSRQCAQCTGPAGQSCVGGHIPSQRFARTFGGYVVEMKIELEAVKKQ